MTESWTRALSDYTDVNGRVFGYAIYQMENGEKIFGHYEGVTQTPQGGKTSTPVVITLTGGTGKFKDLRGMLRGINVGTFSGGRAVSNEIQYEGEYWFER